MNQIAKSRDAYFASEEGSKNLAGHTIGVSPENEKYLHNRLEMVFLAGYHAAETAIAAHFADKIKAAIREASE
jgi:hypothetical protein